MEDDDTVGGASDLADLLGRSSAIDYGSHPGRFVSEAYTLARDAYDGSGLFGEALAALFDLAVTALYLERVPSTNWLYCSSSGNHKVLYPFVNACPSCTLSSEFHFVKARKPESGNIGRVTSIILSAFLDCQAKSASGGSFTVRTLSDNGLVDAILVGPSDVCLFEIKSAPLIAFPIEASSNELTELDDSSEPIPVASHTAVVVQSGVEASLIVDATLRIPVGRTERFPSQDHYGVILEWLSAGNNLKAFVDSWTVTYRGYADRNARTATYWFTNGCGAPKPRPATWPRRSGSGHETISDSKSSVGLDRTDDVKKGIYQVLKISTHYKEFFPTNGNFKVFAALVTNIHAVKHHDEYLAELEDLVWTLDGPSRSHVIRRDAGETVIRSTKVYNLFDALISFTAPYFRADLLKGLYAFD